MTIHEEGKREGPKAAFGAGRVLGIGADVAEWAGAGARVFIVADPNVLKYGVLQPALDDLAAHGCVVTVVSDIVAEPKAMQVDAVVARARQARADLVVGVGGGSVLDVAKLVAALAPEGAAVADYAMAANPFPTRGLPVICVPTTAGTGSEMTRTSIFALDSGSKVWAWGDELWPDLALLDPELTVTLPRQLTVATGVDTLVHAVEATTNRVEVPGCDLPAMSAIGLVREYLPRVVADPNDVVARGGMLRAASLAGMAIDRAGTGVAHAMGHALGSLAGVPHGRAVALSLRATLGWNAEAAPGSHAAVGDAFNVLRHPGTSDEAFAHALDRAFEGFLRDLQLPLDVRGDGLNEGDAERLAEAMFHPENSAMLASNCRAVAPEDALSLSRNLLTAV